MEGLANKRRRRSSGLNDVTDDLLFEILLRLPAKIVYRCKSVCKCWLSVISSSCFARSFIRRLSDVNNMLLFRVERKLPCIGQVYALPLDDHSSLPMTFDFIPPLNPDNYDVQLYYLPLKPTTDRLLMAIQAVGNYGGLVLLRGMFVNPVHEFSRSTPRGYPTYFYHYYLCNPITKHWVELPLIPTHDRVGFTCYYEYLPQDAAAQGRIWADVASSYDDYDPNKIEFTVISIKPHEQARVFVINVLSSSSDQVGDGWNLFRVPFPPGWTSRSFQSKVLFMNGKFHWCGKNCIVAYDPFCNPLECDDVVPFPQMDDDIAADFLILEAFQGSLRLVTSFPAKRLVVWDLVDYGNKAWIKKVDIIYNTSDQHRLKFQSSFVGGDGGTSTAPDKVYMVDISYVLEGNPSTITLFDVRNQSQQLVYDPSILDNAKNVHFVEPFISSPWPTPVPLLKNGSTCQL